jgi:hypothetical protein
LGWSCRDRGGPWRRRRGGCPGGWRHFFELVFVVTGAREGGDCAEGDGEDEDVLGGVLGGAGGDLAAAEIVIAVEVGKGAFGQGVAWVYAAIRRALELVREVGLDVRIVSYGVPSEGDGGDH